MEQMVSSFLTIWLTRNPYNPDIHIHAGLFDSTLSESIGAIAGFNFDDSITVISESLPFSGTNDVEMLTTTSNVNISGVWMFQVDGPTIQSKLFSPNKF